MSDQSPRHFLPSGWRILVALVSCTVLGAVIWFAGPSSALKNLGVLPARVLGAFFVLLGINLFVVSLRFWRVLTHIGFAVPWPVALRASMAGHLSSLFFIPLLGQVAGRQFYLGKAGIPPMVNASVAACERTLLAIMSGALAIWGAVFLLGRDAVDTFLSGLALGQVVPIVVAGLLLSLMLGRKGSKFLRASLNGKNLFRLLEIAGITLAGQVLMLSCFMLGFHTVAPTLNMPSLLAASALVSFAASLPISIGGWGIRELASVFVLDLFGVPAASAIAVSILIGLFSMLVLFLAVPILTRKAPENVARAPSFQSDAISVANMEGILTWMFGTLVALFLFFQVQVPLADSLVTLNLADPFAMLTLAALALQIIQHRQLPTWRVGRFNLALAAMSAALVMAFGVGWARIGITQWALGNRLTGWLVLLGYCSAGALLAARLGRHGLRRIVETMTCVVCMTILVQVAMRTMTLWGWHFEGISLSDNFQGYSGNRNTFAFQLLCVASLLMGYSRLFSRCATQRMRSRFLAVAQGIVMFGLLLAGSRAGFGSVLIIFALAWFLGLVPWRFLFLSTATALVLLGLTELFSQLSFLLGKNESPPGMLSIMSLITQVDGVIRWKANGLAFALWLQHPFLGAGLGAFFADSPEHFGIPIVVHSTPLWILAEFGLPGVAAFGWSGFLLLRHAARRFRSTSAERSLLLMLLAFCIFCQVHEILYQRIFWFLLGALLALPRREPAPDKP